MKFFSPGSHFEGIQADRWASRPTLRVVEGFLSSPSSRQPHKVILKHGQELEEEQEELAEHQPLEQEDLNFERWKRRPLPKRTLHQKIDDLKTYLWNAETNEFMGRSGKSWSELVKRDRAGGWGGALEVMQKCVFGVCVDRRTLSVPLLLSRRSNVIKLINSAKV